jgi:hypothetical protein
MRARQLGYPSPPEGVGYSKTADRWREDDSSMLTTVYHTAKLSLAGDRLDRRAKSDVRLTESFVSGRVRS